MAECYTGTFSDILLCPLYVLGAPIGQSKAGRVRGETQREPSTLKLFKFSEQLDPV